MGTVPSAMAGRSALRWGSSAPAATTAAPSMVASAGPGITARAISSTTTASSSMPKPWPPYSSATWMPSHPWAANSSQNGGMVSVSASSRARATSGGQRASSQRRTVRRSSSWSSPMPMGMPYSLSTVRVARCCCVRRSVRTNR